MGVKKRFVFLFMLLSFGFGIYTQHKNNWLTTDNLEVNTEKEIEKTYCEELQEKYDNLKIRYYAAILTSIF